LDVGILLADDGLLFLEVVPTTGVAVFFGIGYGASGLFWGSDASVFRAVEVPTFTKS